VPARGLNPIVRVLRRATIPDLSAWVLPRPNAPFSQFRRTATVPIIDVGFVDALRRGVIEVVPSVAALDGRAVVLADGSRVFPDAIVAATGYRPGLEPLVGHVTAIGEHGIPSPQPHLHFLGIGIPLTGLLHEVGKDAHPLAASVARELAIPKSHPSRSALTANAKSREQRSALGANPTGPRGYTADDD
jgi:putative flavoprotein involved in K+ transport